jgi:hypothetical protein
VALICLDNFACTDIYNEQEKVAEEHVEIGVTKRAGSVQYCLRPDSNSTEIETVYFYQLDIRLKDLKF